MLKPGSPGSYSKDVSQLVKSQFVTCDKFTVYNMVSRHLVSDGYESAHTTSFVIAGMS